MASETIDRSNIFGDSSTALPGDLPPPAAGTTAAETLINKLQWIADNKLADTVAVANWLATAANAGQNASGANSLVRRDLGIRPARDANSFFVLPADVTEWEAKTLPTIPPIPAFPAQLARPAAPALPQFPAMPALPTPIARTAPPTLPAFPALPSFGTISSFPALPAAPTRASLVALPQLSALPVITLPTIPTRPQRSSIPQLPSMPAFPTLPSMPTIPSMSSLPAMPSIPALPTLPTVSLPTLPADALINIDAISTQLRAQIDNLSNSWMAKFLPSQVEVGQLDVWLNQVFSGALLNTYSAKIDALNAQTTTALSNIVSLSISSLSTSIGNAQARLLGNVTAARANVDAVISQSVADVQSIAWSRARDQVARESARKEREALVNWARRGFSLPGGVVARLVAEAQQATLMAAGGIAADEAVKQQSVMLDLAKLNVETYLRIMDSQLVSDMNFTKAVIDANLQSAQIQVSANQAIADLSVKNLGLIFDFTKFTEQLAVEYRSKAMDAINGLISAYASTRSNEIQYADAIARGKRELYAALNDYFRAALSAVEVTFKPAELSLRNSEIALRAADMMIQADDRNADYSLRAAQLSLDGVRLNVEANDRAIELGIRSAEASLRAADISMQASDRNQELGLRAAEMTMSANDRAQTLSLQGADLTLRSHQIALDMEQKNMSNVLKHIDIAANFIVAAVGHHVQAASATGTMFAQAAGQALSGLNGVASVTSAA